ncbi:MAG: hypothetical protein ACQKBT_00190, partial [Puniceicoccales bacterium]
MFAVIRIPDFSLASILWREENSPPPPRAVAVRANRKSIVACVDDEARKCGVAPGMATARALARCAELSILAENPSAEASAMEWLIALGFGVSPRVEATIPGQVTVDLRGVRDLSKIAGLLNDRADRVGMPIRVGISDTPERAEWASWHPSGHCHAIRDEELFEGVSPGELPLPPMIRQHLEEWGIRSLFSFVRLSKEDVERRLGPEGGLFWERMKGRRARLLEVVEDPPSFYRDVELE